METMIIQEQYKQDFICPNCRSGDISTDVEPEVCKRINSYVEFYICNTCTQRWREIYELKFKGYKI